MNYIYKGSNPIHFTHTDNKDYCLVSDKVFVFENISDYLSTLIAKGLLELAPTKLNKKID